MATFSPFYATKLKEDDAAHREYLVSGRSKLTNGFGGFHPAVREAGATVYSFFSLQKVLPGNVRQKPGPSLPTAHADNSHMTILPEQELVRRILRGDTRSEEQLYRLFSVPMFRVCLRYARDRAEAEDMLQEGFLQVFADLRDFRFEGSLEGWIRRIIVRTALRQLRQRHGFEQLTEETLAQETADQALLSEDSATLAENALIARLMQQLPAGYRTVLNLFAIEGYSHEEIAGLLGINVGTSRSQLHKARAQLKKLLYPHLTTASHHE